MKKIVIITRAKEQVETHLFRTEEEQPLPENSELDKFLVARLNIATKEKECIINIIESDSFEDWATMELYDSYSIVKEKLQQEQWSDKEVLEFMSLVKNSKSDDIKSMIEPEIENLRKTLPAFKCKRILLSKITSNEEWFRDGEIILLPCYIGETQINYDPKDIDTLIEAIAKTFDMKESSENYLYIHDKEWSNASSNSGYPIPVEDLPSNARKYFAITNDDNKKVSNVRVFSHSQGSFYFTQILSKLENLMRVTTLEQNRNILKDPLHGCKEDNITLEMICEREKEVILNL
jgi:hypothetical protein